MAYTYMTLRQIIDGINALTQENEDDPTVCVYINNAIRRINVTLGTLLPQVSPTAVSQTYPALPGDSWIELVILGAAILQLNANDDIDQIPNLQMMFNSLWGQFKNIYKGLVPPQYQDPASFGSIRAQSITWTNSLIGKGAGQISAMTSVEITTPQIGYFPVDGNG